MSVTFCLKDPQHGIKPSQQVPTPIMLLFHFRGERIKLGIGESIHPCDWNQKARKPRISAIGAVSLQKYMDKLAIRVKEIYLSLVADNDTVTPEMMKTAIYNELVNKKSKLSFLQFFDQYYNQKKESGAKNYKLYKSAMESLKRFPGSKNYNDIDHVWFEKYQTYMQNYRDEVTVPNGYSPNYISRQITTFREVLAAARKAGHHKNDKFESRDFKKPSEVVQTIYLTTAELMQMYNCDKYTETEKKVMHRFMIGAFTGLRFSDSSVLTLEAIRDGLIYDRNQKTGTDVVIPIHKVVSEIMAMYPEGLPPSLSNQKCNDHLKKIGEKADIKTPIVLTRIRGGKAITDTVDKFNLITTHTGRRSFATNASLAGIPDQAIMKITGHKTAASFQKYIRSTSEQSAKSIQNHPFFSGQF